MALYDFTAFARETSRIGRYGGDTHGVGLAVDVYEEGEVVPHGVVILRG